MKKLSEKQIFHLKHLGILDRTIEIIQIMFEDIKDKAGRPYIEHLCRVARPFIDDLDKYVTALLHDLIEDTIMTFDDLRQLDYPDSIIDTLKFLTKEKDEDYMKYIDKIAKSKNLTAKKVKISDLCDNMNLNRLPNITETDIKRALKYKESYEIIVKEVLNNE